MTQQKTKEKKEEEICCLALDDLEVQNLGTLRELEKQLGNYSTWPIYILEILTENLTYHKYKKLVSYFKKKCCDIRFVKKFLILNVVDPTFSLKTFTNIWNSNDKLYK